MPSNKRSTKNASCRTFDKSLTLPVEQSQPRQCGPHLSFEHPLVLAQSSMVVVYIHSPTTVSQKAQLGQETGHPADLASNFAHFVMPDHSTRAVHDVGQCLKKFLNSSHVTGNRGHFQLVDLGVDLQLSADPDSSPNDPFSYALQTETTTTHTHGQPSPLMCRAFEWNDGVIHEAIGLRSAVGQPSLSAAHDPSCHPTPHQRS